MARYEVHVLVPADGQRYVGEWQRVSTHRAEADALRALLPILRSAIDDYDSLLSGYHYRKGSMIERPEWGELIARIDAALSREGK
jgi:hypothetical protein